jgi:RHS repeat-associated protein
VTVTAAAFERLPGSITFNIQPALRIESVTPASGAVESIIALSGTGFDPVPANNQIVFRGINSTTVAAAVLSASTTQLSVRVPPLAESGPITLTNARGTTTSPPFTVSREQDYQLVTSPASLIVFQGASGSVQLQLSSTGTKPYAGIVTLSALGLPAGVTASFSPAASLSALQSGTLTLAATGAAAPGIYPITVHADSTESGRIFSRTSSVNLNVQAAVGVTGVKGRFVTPAGQGIAGVIVRADISPTSQPQTVTDAAGNFQFVGLPAGQFVLRFDATPANPLYPIWPYLITLPANQISVIADWTINPPPTADKFVPIANAAQEQVVTDPRFPGLEVRLPAGTTITGYDGVVKTRIAIEKVELTKLPVTAPPTPTGAAYQMYFGTPMGGIPSTPIPVTLPNDVAAEPGDSVNVYFFDGSPMGGTGDWKVAGQGIVSADGKSVRMPNGTGIPRFCGVCGLMCLGKQTPAPDIAPVNRKCDGNPVDLANGQEMPTTGGLRCGGLTPISTGMTYNPVDAFNNIGGTVGSIGFGWVLDYDIAFLPFDGAQKRLVLPGNNRVNFTNDGSGNYKPFDDPRFDGAVITATNLATNEWQLKFKDGRLWRFKPFAGIPTFIRGGPPTFVTEMVDAQGNVLTITRQSNGRISSVGSVDRNVSMSYGSNGFVSEMRDSAERAVSFTYTASNRIATVTDPDGRATRYTYVGDSEFSIPVACGVQPSFGERLKTITYPGRPVPTENFYGPGRRVLRQTGYDGREYRFSYKVTGACVTNVSSPNTVCTGVGCPDSDSWENFQAGWRIHGGTVVATAVTQPNGQTKSSEFNARGVSTSSTDAQGQRASTKVDAANRITERSDALGRTWKYQYDALGNVTQATDPLGRITNTTYHPTFNKPTSVTRFDEANQPQTWSFSYDAVKGTLLTATSPLNQTTSFAYSVRGELERVTDALAHATRFEYNAAGDLATITDALSNVTTFGVDGAGRRTAATDPLGFITRSAYNGVDRVTRVTDARNGQTSLAYDPAGRLESVTNAKNVLTESYGYDSGDRMTTRSDAANRQMLYEYDPFGRLSRVIDRKAQATSYDYDGQDRVLTATRPEGVTRFTYDAVGRLAQIADQAGTISYAYDTVDRLVQETQATGAVTSVVNYAYDTLDRRISRSVQGVANETTSYGYDRANRLTSILYRGQTTSFEYDAAGRLTRKTLPNAIRQELAYDAADRLLSITYKRPDDSLIEAIGYGYDANGRRVTETKSAAPLADTAFTAQYDAADRMTSIVLTVTGQSFTLAYDENGNLASKTETTNPSNQTLYSWDSRNRLTGIQGPGVNAAFSYDALGRRVARSMNGQTVSYVYDGLQAVGEIGPNGAVGLLTGRGLDEVIARYTNAGARTYLTDALNTVLAQTREDQSVQNFYAYSPYGEASTLGDNEGNAIQYTARENDNTGLYFYRARYYDPVLKRFISEDPIGMTAGLNFYKFVNNNPVSFTDPTGLICMFSQTSGGLVCTDETTGWPYVDTTGYSGAGAGRNNPNMQDIVDVGPIPQGCWIVGAPTGSRGTGPYSLPLTPLPGNDVFNTPRDPNSFLIHGPNANRPNDSSNGCPVIDRPSRQAIPIGEIFCVTPW